MRIATSRKNELGVLDLRLKIKTGYLDELRNRGFRITKVRLAVEECFRSSRSPLSVAEVSAGLETQNLRVNKTTLYREIVFLLQQNVVREIDLLDGRKRYELVGSGDHHHHFVCTACQRILCVPIPPSFEALEKKLAKSVGFKVTKHVLEFFGLCRACH